MNHSLWKELERNQKQATKYIVYQFCNGDHGIGSEFHMMVPSLSMAVHTNRAFVVQGPWIFAGNQSFSYWFKPLVVSSTTPFTHTTKSIDPHSLASAKVIEIDPMTSYTTVNELYGHPPEKYADQYTIMQWKGQLLNFLMQPNQRLLKAIQEQQSPPKPFIGLQIRHSCNWTSKTRQNIPLSEYMIYVDRISKRTGIRTVFVSTEDQTVIDQCLNNNYPNYRFYFTKNHLRTNQNQAKAIIAGKLNGVEEGRIGLVNLFLMRDASYLVGGFQSNWGRLVLEHMSANNEEERENYGYSLERIPIERYKPDSNKYREFSEFNQFYVGHHVKEKCNNAEEKP